MAFTKFFREAEEENQQSSTASNEIQEDQDQEEQEVDLSDEDLEDEEVTNSDEQQEDEEDGELTAQSFFGNITKTLGVDVEFSPEDEEPTAEDYALYSKAVYEKGKQDFLNDLQNSRPDLYQVYEYAQHGGDPADLFKQTTPDVNIEDAVTAKNYIEAYYKQTGTDEAMVKAYLEKAEDEGTLVEHANRLKDSYKKQLDEQRQQLVEQQKKEQEAFNNRVNEFRQTVQKQIVDGDLGKFKILKDKDKQEFNEFVQQNLALSYREDSEFAVMLDITPENREEVLQALYFLKKGGNLDDVVRNKAKTMLLKSRNSKKDKARKTRNRISDLYKS